MMRRFVILPILALGLLPAFAPAPASAATVAAPQFMAATSAEQRLGDKAKKPRRPPRKPGPQDGSDGD